SIACLYVFNYLLNLMEITKVQKRNGDIKDFNIQKIIKAVGNAMREVGDGERDDAEKVAELVYQELLQRAEMNPKYIPNMEEIQDTVEEALMVSGHRDVARAYIIYRQARAAE